MYRHSPPTRLTIQSPTASRLAGSEKNTHSLRAFSHFRIAPQSVRSVQKGCQGTVIAR
jgi:hypothetical protein